MVNQAASLPDAFRAVRTSIHPLYGILKSRTPPQPPPCPSTSLGSSGQYNKIRFRVGLHTITKPESFCKSVTFLIWLLGLTGNLYQPNWMHQLIGMEAAGLPAGFHPYQRPAYLLLVINFPIQLFLFCVDDYVCGCISYDVQGDDGHSRRVVHG